jgi:hypothetical protein
MESAELLGAEDGYSEGLRLVARLVRLTFPKSPLEIPVAERSRTVKAYYAQKARFP